MMKRITSLMAAAMVAAVGLSPAWGQDVQGEDYTSHLANPSFTEGASTLPGDTISSTAGRGYIMAPKGWRMTYMTTTWDRQFLTYSDYTSATGLDGFQTPLLEPQDADNGFYFHAITGGGSAPRGTIYSVLQDVNTLPAGRYTLTFYGFLKDRSNATGGTELSVPKIIVETPFGVSETEMDTLSIAATAEWMPGEVSFALTEDNMPVTLGLRFELKGLNEQQLYMDNFRLYRTGDATSEDMINQVNSQTGTYRNELATKHLEIDYSYLPEGWDDTMYAYEDGEGMDTISSVLGAQAYQAQVQFWIARMDSLIDYRTVQIPMWNDSLQTLIDAAQYEGIDALQTLLQSNTGLMEGQTENPAFAAAIAATEQAVYDYLLNGAMSVVTYDNPSDVTGFFIVNPTIEGERAQVAPEGWDLEVINSGQPWLHTGDRYYEDGTPVPSMYFNTWNPTAGQVEYTATQDLGTIPVGIYTLRALVAGDGNQGTYLFVKVGDEYYSAEAVRSDDVFDTLYVENVLVLDENAPVTIGFTNQADSLWADAHASDATYVSADDFALFYQGSDPSALKGVLEEAIAEMEAYLTDTEEGAAALKGDVAAVQAVIAEAREIAQGTDFAAYGRALSNLNAQYTIITASATAAGNVQTTIDEANALIQESGSKMTDAKAPLETEVTIAATWLESDDAVTADAEALIDNILAAIEVAEDSIRSWEKQHLVVGDATACLVNPTIEDGTKGYHMDAFGGAYIVSASDFFDDGHSHLCFWSGALPADSVGFDIYQNVGHVPSGYYRMTAMAVAGKAGDASEGDCFSNGNVVFYAIGDVDHEVQVPIRHALYESGDTLTFSSSGRLDSTYNYYSNQPYQYVLDRILVNHGEFRFGMKTIGPMNVTTARIYNFTLEYLEPVDYEPYPDAIEEVGADAAELKAYAQNGYIIVETDEPYTIVSVNGGVVPDTDAQLVPGVYIVRAGSKTVKVVVD